MNPLLFNPSQIEIVCNTIKDCFPIDEETELLDYSILTNYDGRGSCKEIIFTFVTYQAEFEGEYKKIVKHLKPWTNAIGWKSNLQDEPCTCECNILRTIKIHKC